MRLNISPPSAAQILRYFQLEITARVYARIEEDDYNDMNNFNFSKPIIDGLNSLVKQTQSVVICCLVPVLNVDTLLIYIGPILSIDLLQLLLPSCRSLHRIQNVKGSLVNSTTFFLRLLELNLYSTWRNSRICWMTLTP